MMIPIVVFLGAAQAGSSVQTKPPAAPILQVGVFSYGPDGKPQAAAYETSLATESFQYIAGCVIGGGNRPVPERATDAWRTSGKIDRMTEDEAVVRIDWQRIRSGGVATTSPGGSVQLTLHPGDHVPLDSATPEPTAGCGARAVGFEARFEPRPGWMAGPKGPLTESPSAIVMHNHGSGAGTGAGGSAEPGSGSGSGVGAGSGSGSGGGGFISATSVPKTDVTNGTGARTFTAELFLVRTDKAHPEKPDFNLQGLTLQNVRQAADFAFSPFTIETPGGPINVQITGSLRVSVEDGGSSLVFTTSRTVRYSSSESNRDATSTSTGSSTTKNPLPGSDDVLSFELPPIRVPNSTAPVPDQYSIRLRIR